MKLAAFNIIPRSVVALGVVSLLTDMSSEMIYPLLPLYLTGVLGASAISLGLIEGAAEATASILKVFSGVWTDKLARRKPFIFMGYGLSGLMRPLIGLAGNWPVVMALRLLDRMGKGIRNSPRDALIADVTPTKIRGKAFGFHRMMDHAGAVSGPLIAMALLSGMGLSLQAVFLCAAVPGIAVMLVILLGVKEPETPKATIEKKGKTTFSLKEFNREFKLFLGCLVLFALGSSTDAFILLKLSDAGLSPTWVAGVWAAHNLVKMGTAYLGGALSDSLGRRRILTASWLMYAAVYFCFAYFQSLSAVIVVFMLYGLYFGLSEPTERAWVADLAPEKLHGTAMGLYHGIIGLAALPASLLFGVLWYQFGQGIAFATGGCFALAASILLLLLLRNKEAEIST